MGYYPVYDESILSEGPLFRDEIGWTHQITQQLADKYELGRRSIRYRGGSGVYTIYFPLPTLEAALIRYAHRYRGVIEVALGRGLSGERMLYQQGWYEDELQYLRDIIPSRETEYNPAVYELLWKSLTYPEYLAIIEVLRRNRVFVPSELIEAAGLEDAEGFFSTFIRSNMIRESERRSDQSRGRGSKSSIDIDPEKKYIVTDQGSQILEGSLKEHDRLFESESYAPLHADVDAARAHIPPEEEVSEPTKEEEVAELDVPEAEEFSELADQLESSLNEI